jgi:hypothetical protein
MPPGVRVAVEACEGYDLTPVPVTDEISIASLQEHLQAKGISYEVLAERGDLHLFDVMVGGEKNRLRVATLPNHREAGRHLHEALLEHGSGYWGVHRANLAVLGPPASRDDVIAFAVETGLACWGVLTVVGRDDSFVIPGGYFEL